MSDPCRQIPRILRKEMVGDGFYERERCAEGCVPEMEGKREFV